MHCAVAGLSSQQRGSWKSKKVSEETEVDIFCDVTVAREDSGTDTDTGTGVGANSDSGAGWYDASAMNNLADAVDLHCDYKMDKSPVIW